jgi:hypothetical protein
MKSRLAIVFVAVSAIAVIGTAPLSGQQAPPAGAPAQAARPAPL